MAPPPTVTHRYFGFNQLSIDALVAHPKEENAYYTLCGGTDCCDGVVVEHRPGGKVFLTTDHDFTGAVAHPIGSSIFVTNIDDTDEYIPMSDELIRYYKDKGVYSLEELTVESTSVNSHYIATKNGIGEIVVQPCNIVPGNPPQFKCVIMVV
jgi:hypothetical protein